MGPRVHSKMVMNTEYILWYWSKVLGISKMLCCDVHNSWLGIQCDSYMYVQPFCGSWHSLPPHPTAAKPPSDIRAHRQSPDAPFITITWNKPTSGATPTAYIIYYEAMGDQGIQTVQDGSSLPTMLPLPVNSTIQEYRITMVTLSDMLPSEESSPVET